MNGKLAAWLRKEIRPLGPPRVPSPLARKLGRWVRIGLLAVFCVFVFWRVMLHREVSRQLAQLRSAGLPTSGAELNIWMSPPPNAQNGALILTQAFALVRTFPDSRSNQVAEPRILSRTNVWTAETRALVQDYVETNAPALIRAREGLQAGRFRYPVDFSFGPETELPHLRELKTLARIAALRAVVNAEDGPGEFWSEDVELQIQLAQTLNDEPTLISHLVRNAMIRSAVKTTERCLNRSTPGLKACQRLQQALDREVHTNRLQQAFVGERAMLIPIFRLSWREIQRFSDADDKGGGSRRPQRYSGNPNVFLWLSGFFERDLSFFLQAMGQCAVWSALPPPQSLGLTNYLGSATELARRRYYVLSGLLLPAYSGVAVRNESTRALVETARAALAVERFREVHHRLPERLAEAVPEFLDSVPADPFDAAPLRYRLLKRGYVVYSVGADGQDDGGSEPPERRGKKVSREDITFVVER